ncbi:LON peptidase N-terminal domain and RING finger protein 1 isoform X2 [Ambystoma mexicanum]|uniref:LON peptidase N-terminal domain and RING finger protein 1 isoform X2 n=1 Tax=Ambystoma mexicanum TaxID=8296 RepID=UPI0037E80BB3
MDLLRCPACLDFLWDPVTVSCGHSVCKRCLGGASRCPGCRQRLTSLGVREARCNVLLGGLLDKCLDAAHKVALLKGDLRELLRRHDYREALRVAQRAVDLAPEDISLRLSRAEVYRALMQYPQALEDLCMVCRTEPGSAEGFYRKGEVLALMGEKMEALRHLHRCLTLNPNFCGAQKAIEKLLGPDMSLLPDAVADLLPVLTQYLSEASPGTELIIEPLVATSLEEARNPGSQCESRELAGGDVGSLHVACQLDPPLQGTMTRDTTKRKAPQLVEDSAEERLNANEGDNVGSTALNSVALSDLLSPADFECSLCVRMFFEPVTTPCGHSFCKECLERCLDHRPCCPLCKQSLREYLKDGQYTPTAVLQEIMAATFPTELSERKQVHELEMAELSNLTTDVPIFVCTLAFPGIACPLHIFEPRYRLMMRRCQETGTKRFGMCIYERGKSFADFGCMLEIIRLEYLADGRSLVDTMGRRRFRVLKRGHRDGYHTADVEYLEDKKVEGEELAELQRLHDLTYQQVENWLSEDRADVSRPSFLHCGPLPKKDDDIQVSPDGPAWCWWLLSILPLDPTYQTMILSMTSLKDRLTHMKHILSVFTQNPT